MKYLTNIANIGNLSTYIVYFSQIMKLREFFYKNPIFTHGEFSTFLKAHGTDNFATQNTILKYHINQGQIKRVRCELYVVSPPTADPETFPIDVYLLASKMTKDAVLAYHTALELHGLAYSSFEYLTYLSSHKYSTSINFKLIRI